MLFFVVICVVVIFVMLANANQDRPVTKPVAHNYYTGCVVQKTGVDYDNLPYSNDILVRFRRVENKEYNCICVNRASKTAVFKSRFYPNTLYYTNLNKCSCLDCNVPCKHMLYLADCLGYLENWKRNLPHEKYYYLAKFYDNCDYSKRTEQWVRNKTCHNNNWHPGQTRIGGCW